MTLWSDIAQWRGPVLHHSGTISDHRYVIVHTAEGSYEGTISWQKNPDSDNSSHFIVDFDGKIAQVNDTANRSGAQKAGNPYSISIENAGNHGTALTDAQLTANAKILAKAHQVYGIPLQVTNNPDTRGLGHHSMGCETGVDWGHCDCPGNIIKAQKAQIVGRAISIVNGAIAPPHKNGAGMYWSATQVPAGVNDVLGSPVVNNTRMILTPKGPVALLYGEIIDLYTDSPKLFQPMSWPRLNLVANAFRQDPIDPAALAVQISEHYPVDAVTADVILNAFKSEAGHDTFLELMDLPEVKTILAEEASQGIKNL
jgi:hypothetical protein